MKYSNENITSQSLRRDPPRQLRMPLYTFEILEYSLLSHGPGLYWDSNSGKMADCLIWRNPKSFLCIRSHSPYVRAVRTEMDRGYRKNRGRKREREKEDRGQSIGQKRRRNKFAHARRGGNWPAIFARLTDNCRRDCFPLCFIPSLCSSSLHFLSFLHSFPLFFSLSFSAPFLLSCLSLLPSSDYSLRNAVSIVAAHTAPFGSVVSSPFVSYIEKAWEKLGRYRARQ